ncbi:MAG: periplasmic nitrate reductase subunit alpha, partial [Gammaproteobacteria bacterium]|nr:periplasmic nitrate reductase subunit alpha [Gammaproteobacteria bacterium]
QVMEFSKRFKLTDVWGEQDVPGLKAPGFDDEKLPDVLEAAIAAGYSADDTLYEVLFATDANKKVAWPDPVAKGHDNSTVTALGEEWFPEKALFEEYAAFGRGHHHDLADFDHYYDDDVRG